MIKAVLFDMDGTLVDTESVDNTVALGISGNFGLKLTKEEQEVRHGRTTKSFYEWLAKSRGGNFDVDGAIKNHLDSFQAELQKSVTGFPGAKELLKMLKNAGYKMAIVSGGTKANLDTIVKTLGIESFFNVIVSADDVMESKPSPEGYLLAAQKLGVQPQECVVIEDGAKGIEAGKSAGMKVIGIINNGGQDLSGADRIVNNLSEVTNEILNT